MKYLKKLETKYIDIENKFFVFDTETTKLEPMSKNFVFGVIYGKNYIKVIKSIKGFKNEFNKEMYKKKIIFAHNAQFDLLTIFGNIFKYVDSKAIFNNKFISARYNGFIFADSYNILPSSVKSIGLTMKMEKMDNEKIRTGNLTKKNITKQDINYCIRDCEIVYKALLKIFIEIGSIKITLSSLSFYKFRSDFLKKNLLYSELVYEFFKSYYGGRTEAFKIGNCNGAVYDINSLYPYVMSDMYFPNPLHLKKLEKVNINSFYFYLKNYEGLACLTIKHKDFNIGLLPYKDKKLFFPVGIFKTIVNFNEIRAALQYDYIEIISIDYIIFSEPEKTIFKSFVDYYYNKRILTDNELDKYIYKIVLNSLYGRFGMRKKYLSEYFETIPDKLLIEYGLKNIWYKCEILNKEINDCLLTIKNPQTKYTFNSIPLYSSYITSKARTVLLENILRNNYENILYCDTDSIFINNNFLGIIGKSLGEFKNENKTIIKINGLKNYVYIDQYGMNHEIIKGIENKAMKDGNIYSIPSYYKTKQALKMNVEAGKSYMSIKTISNIYDKRIMLSDGNTKPVTIGLSN
jgi:hypothetical protein